MNAEEKQERIEKLVESKSFDELTHSEKEFVLEELGSEEQFTALRKVSLTLVYASTTDLSPDPKVLASLREKLNDRRPAISLWSRVVEMKIPAWAAAAAVIICSLIMWKVVDKPVTVLPSSAKNEIQGSDTIFVASAPDTIFIERVVYRTVTRLPAASTNIYSVVKNSSEEKEESAEGVSMEEKKELDKLLVSGSR